MAGEACPAGHGFPVGRDGGIAANPLVSIDITAIICYDRKVPAAYAAEYMSQVTYNG